MKLKPISLTRKTNTRPMARVVSSGNLSLNAEAARTFGLKPGSYVQVATDREAPDSDNLYLIFTDGEDASLKLSGKANNINIAFRSVGNTLGLDPENYIYEYHLSREFTVDGNRVIELVFEGKKARK